VFGFLLLVILFISLTRSKRTDVSLPEFVQVEYKGLVTVDPSTCRGITDSTLVKRICYDENKKYLIIKLQEKYYHYCGIPKATIDNLLIAESKGGFYNTHIKGQENFDCRSVEPISSVISTPFSYIEPNPEQKVLSDHLAKGLRKVELGQYLDAVKEFDKAIEAKPNYYFIFYTRGNAKASLGQYSEAIKDYDKAIQLNPIHAFSFYNRGVAKTKLGYSKSANADIAIARTLDPDLGK